MGLRLLAGLIGALALPAGAETITRAALVEPTTRYDHAVLGDAVEWGALRLDGPGGPVLVRLPETRVFEDVEARIVRLGPGTDAVLVVETDVARGASVVLYGADGARIAATPFIGQKNRWYAPVGAADFGGDGAVEIAYVDRPHLEKALVFARVDGASLVAFARLPGLTNHRIGDSAISSGVRDCGAGDEVILPSADWQDLMAATPKGARRLGPFSAKALKAALACR
ncbi:MAG: VCBS repeat-containing protein [Pseudorhodobacter sp.]|nr:MAG: VCBS repeat-containing protein [Pseudorhodobacter sp.]